jgi:2-polyprenyl-3-methyl-5-hydroxy-6-metoxy-1,4-benzoquinol methylase
MNPVSAQQSSAVDAARHERIKGSPAAREVWEQQYRSGGWDYLAGEDEAGHYLAIAEFCRRHLRGSSLLDIGCGTGILVGCLQRHAGMAPSRYTGIDLAEAAVRQAASSHPGARITRLDYSTDVVPGRYDGVIFNETLYCFDDPVAILDKSIADNMHAGSLLIISMYGDHHEAIWDAIASRCDTVDEQVVENSRGVRWKIRALRPKAETRTGHARGQG